MRSATASARITAVTIRCGEKRCRIIASSPVSNGTGLWAFVCCRETSSNVAFAEACVDPGLRRDDVEWGRMFYSNIGVMPAVMAEPRSAGMAGIQASRPGA